MWFGGLGVQEDGADREQPPRAIEDGRAIGSREASQHSGIQILNAAAAKHVHQLSAPWHRAAGMADEIELMRGRHELRQRRRGIAQHHKKGTFPGVREITGGLEQTFGQYVVVGGSLPHFVLCLEVEQMPASVSEAE